MTQDTRRRPCEKYEDHANRMVRMYMSMKKADRDIARLSFFQRLAADLKEKRKQRMSNMAKDAVDRIVRSGGGVATMTVATGIGKTRTVTMMGKVGRGETRAVSKERSDSMTVIDDITFDPDEA